MIFALAPLLWGIAPCASLSLHGLGLSQPSVAQVVALSNTAAESSRVVTQDYAVMVPTYIGHKKPYRRLVQSMVNYVEGDLFELVTVFSSQEESELIYAECPACQKPYKTDRKGTAIGPTKFTLRTLIFNHKYEGLDKFNYQCVKKLWALEQLTQERVLLFDSDFTLVKPMNLPSLFRDYEHVLYPTKSQFPLDKQVLANLNGLMNSTYDMSKTKDLFPLETPWIFTKGKVHEMLAFLSKQWGTNNYVDFMLGHNVTFFETILYRHYVLASDPDFYNVRPEIAPHIHKHWHENFLFEMALNDTERAMISPPPIAITCSMNSKRGCDSCACKECFLQVHNDRKGCMVDGHYLKSWEAN